MKIDTSFLNRTPNRDHRPASAKWVGVVWHGTGGNPANPEGTLRYNLDPAIKSSYHDLISSSGTWFKYLDPDEYNAWHAGVSAWTVAGTTYRDYGINSHFLGVELDETNKGVAAPQAQLDAAARLALYYRDKYGIPLIEPYHVTHKQIAPGRKHDPTCLTVKQILKRAVELAGTPPPPPPPVDDRLSAWGSIPVDWHFGIPQRWDQERKAGRPLGRAVTPEIYLTPDGYSVQCFERGSIIYRVKDGKLSVGRFE